MERKLLTELSLDPDTFPVESNEDLSTALLGCKQQRSCQLSSYSPPLCQLPASRHRISRVVVLHEDKLETFFNDPTESRKQHLEPQQPLHHEPQQDGDSDFFDNDSFWSGSITWY